MPYPYFDAHCDTATELFKQNAQLSRNSGHFDIIRAGQFAPMTQCFALFGDSVDGKTPLYGRYTAALAYFNRQLSQNAEAITLCRTAADISAAHAAGAIATILTVEGAEMLNCDPAMLGRAYADGVRCTGITWNRNNALSGCCRDEHNGGLTEKGREFVAEAIRLGMLVDVSHLSDAGFWDVADMHGGRPFVATHSNARSLCGHCRNLTDEQFVAIVRSGGAVGLNLYNVIVDDEPRQADIDRLIDHLDHFASLHPAALRHIGIGADFDGVGPGELIGGITQIADLQKLFDRMKNRGYSIQNVEDVCYNNWDRAFRAIM